MDKQEIIANLISNIKTTESLSPFLEDLEEASRWVYKGGSQDLSEKLQGKVGEEFRQKLAVLEGSGTLPSSRKELSDFLKSLEQTLDKIPILKLKLAFLPSKDFLIKLSDWVEQQSGNKAFLDIEVKEEIIGGCIFEYQGEYRDYSLGAKLESALEQEIQRLI